MGVRECASVCVCRQPLVEFYASADILVLPPSGPAVTGLRFFVLRVLSTDSVGGKVFKRIRMNAISCVLVGSTVAQRLSSQLSIVLCHASKHLIKLEAK